MNNETYQNCPRCNRSNYVIHNKLGNKQHIRLVPDIRLGPTSNGNRNFSSVYEVWPAIKIYKNELFQWRRAYITMKSILESNLAAFSALQQEYYTQNNVNDVKC